MEVKDFEEPKQFFGKEQQKWRTDTTEFKTYDKALIKTIRCGINTDIQIKRMEYSPGTGALI